MASLIESLYDILKEETGCYKTLLEMADNKKEVIIKGNVPSLQEITKKEQQLAGHILRLEKKREANLKDICDVTNRPIEEMTITKVIDLITGKEKDQLLVLTEELSGILGELKEKNDANKLLIEQSVDYIDFTVNAIQSMSAGPQSNAYQAKGKYYDDGKGRNFFNAKQ